MPIYFRQGALSALCIVLYPSIGHTQPATPEAKPAAHVHHGLEEVLVTANPVLEKVTIEPTTAKLPAEVVQDTFVRAYRALLEYEPERIRDLRLRGWLAAITSNLARNRSRRAAPAPTGLEAVAERADEVARLPEQALERREAALAWRRRLDSVPARYRQAVELRHVSGLSYPELALVLGRPVGTVKSDVHRGLRLLREVVGLSLAEWEECVAIGAVEVAAPR